MIYTITMNPSIDYYLILEDRLIENEVNRTTKEYYKVGGKGLNVSQTLDILSIQNTAITLVGGVTGVQILEKLKFFSKIKVEHILVENENRMNVKIFNGTKSYSVNAKGIEVTKELQDRILDKLLVIKEGDWVMLCGSMIYNSNDQFIQKISTLVRERESKLVIDMESLNLDLLRKIKPFMIKPNLYEFKILMEDDSITLENIDDHIDKVLETGLSSVLISLGVDGAIYASQDARYKLNQPAIKAINNVGTGDAMLATFIGCLSRGEDIAESLKMAGAAGCLKAMTQDEIVFADFEKITQQFIVEKYNNQKED